MTIVADQFSIAELSRTTVRLPCPSSSGVKQPQALLTTDVPTLTFNLGAEIQATLYGNGLEPSIFWKVLEKLKHLGSLSDNWSSYGSAAVSPEVIRRTVRLLHLILTPNAPVPDIVPTRDGGLQFEWHKSGVDIELSIPLTSPIFHYIAIAGADDVEESGIPEWSLLERAFERMS